jgi:hypothetical protein
MEELLGAVTGGAVWGIGFAIGLGAIRAAGDGLRPVMRNAMRGAVAATSWVEQATTEGRETIKDLYHEAKVEHEAEAHPTSV